MYVDGDVSNHSYYENDYIVLQQSTKKDKSVLSTCKIWPNFETLKCNNFCLIVIKISSYIYVATFHKEINITYQCWITHTE